MYSNRITGPVHDFLWLDDTKPLKPAAAQEMTSDNRGARNLADDQTNRDQSSGIIVAQRVGLEWQLELAIFESTKEPGIFAFTLDKTGCNLPACYAPWRDLQPGRGKQVFRKDAGISLHAAQGVLLAVQAEGFCLACNQSTFRRIEQNLGPANTISGTGK